MKSFTTTSLVLLFLLSSLVGFQPAFAEIHEGHNVIGLATEPNQTGAFELADPGPGSLQLHLMVYGYDHPQGIIAWDCAVILPPSLELVSTTFSGGGSDELPVRYSYRVTTELPLMPVDGIIHLATLNLINLNFGAKDIMVSGDPLWVNQEQFGFARETFETIRLPFNWPDRCQECPVFAVTTFAAGENLSSWGQLKAIYR